MTVRERAVWWVAIVAAFFGFIWLFKGILLPFVAGIAIAYFLDPLADRLERLRVPRGLAAIIALIAFCVVAIAFVLLLVPVIQSQLTELSDRLPAIVAAIQAFLVDGLAHLKTVLSEQDFERLRSALAGQIGQSVKVAAGFMRNLVSQGMAFFEFVSVLLVTPVVAFYLLRDWDRMIADLDSLIPREYRHIVHAQMREVDDTLAGFARGQASVCLILGFGYGGALALAGLPFGFTVGIAAGLVSFIPYVGSVFGAIVSIGLALVEFDSIGPVLIVAAIFGIGQAIEGNYLTPKLVGERVRLHPVWVIFALFAGGALLGFLGMLIAVPVAAVIGVVMRFLVTQYLGSRLYDEEPEDDPPGGSPP